MIAGPMSRDSGSAHRARAFAAPPGRGRALALLAELATAPCRFAPVEPDRPLALYGAGNFGVMARDFLKAVGQDFAVVIDRNAAALSEATEWSGVSLMHPDAVPAATKVQALLAVSVVTSPYVPLEQELRERGFAHVVPFYDVAENFRRIHPLSNGWFAAPLSAAGCDNAGEVMVRWDDDISRAHYLQFLAWRRLREEWNFAGAPMPSCARFFIPEIEAVLRDDESLLDAGAHHGGVMQAFLQRTRGKFSGILAVEPDRFNRAQLETAVQSAVPGGSVTIHDFALADTDGSALFHDGLGYASQIAATGKTRVDTRRLDGLGLSPSFVKLHLEGGELAALKGARETLIAERPIVAVTVYHNADGIWQTPLWLMQTLPRYRFLFRAHSWCGTGAVVYAIPQERAAR